MAGGGTPAVDNLRQRKGAVLLFKFCSLCENIHTNLNGYPFSNPVFPASLSHKSARDCRCFLCISQPDSLHITV
ncbi:hypothetical protein GBC03_08875 [Citrobacter telavivensis]|uniref:Uncharacterized protein n=1 Tax=Citrobacter telavivensis TaxID=2653932 RepID=A0A6L5E426_9ENTR|nr:hypothetical protein [Citrobacter telavivensis]QFS70313.1 hypothetical protein GBC03_08875 [Citrobacter telavivensis]